MKKDFNNWIKLKEQLHNNKELPLFRERDIWWCSIGSNIGHEEDGKNAKYNRPVLVIRKFNKHIFWGIPLTTQIKEKFYYKKIHFQEKEQCVMLSQLRLWDSNRLSRRMGRITGDQFKDIREELREIMIGNI